MNGNTFYGNISDILKVFIRIIDIPAAIAIAFVIYFGAIYLIVVSNRMMPPLQKRVVSMKCFLDSLENAGSSGDVFILGSSVLLEGIDCNIVDEALSSGKSSYNLAFTGAGPRQWLLMLPSVKAVQPSVVALCADMGHIWELNHIPSARLAIAGFGVILMLSGVIAATHITDTTLYAPYSFHNRKYFLY